MSDQTSTPAPVSSSYDPASQPSAPATSVKIPSEKPVEVTASGTQQDQDTQRGAQRRNSVEKVLLMDAKAEKKRMNNSTMDHREQRKSPYVSKASASGYKSNLRGPRNAQERNRMSNSVTYGIESPRYNVSEVNSSIERNQNQLEATGPGSYEIPGSFGSRDNKKTQPYKNAPSFSIGGSKTGTVKQVISKDHIIEAVGRESPGVGNYDPSIEAVKGKPAGTKFGSGDKYDMYRFVKEVTKSPGPVYNYGVPADLGYSSATKKGAGFGQGNRFIPKKIEPSPSPLSYTLPGQFEPIKPKGQELRKQRESQLQKVWHDNLAQVKKNTQAGQNKPGPGDYNVSDSINLSTKKKPTGYSIGQNDRGLLKSTDVSINDNLGPGSYNNDLASISIKQNQKEQISPKNKQFGTQVRKVDVRQWDQSYRKVAMSQPGGI